MADQADKLRALAKGLKAQGKGQPPSAAAQGGPEPARDPFAARRPRPALGAVPGALPRARVLTVASGKGGVGKTSMAVNLALQLCRLGRRVVLFDADLGLANADLLLGVRPRWNLTHFFDGERSLEELLCEGPLGLQLIASGSGISRLADLGPQERERLIGQLTLLEDRADFLVCDTGAGISANVLSFALASDEVVVVTTPEPTARLDAYGLIKVLSQNAYDGRVRVVVNMADGDEEAQETARLLETLAGRFLNLPVETLGTVPRDREVPRCVRAQKPFSLEKPESPAGQALIRMARELAEVREGAAEPRGLAAFWGRLGAVFKGGA